MDVTIRQETQRDYKLSEQVVEKAFQDANYSRHDEQLLVARLRRGEAFVSQLSLVAELAGEIVGHIMFTKVVVDDGREQHPSLALAPVSVLPQYQGKGIGSQLIKAGLETAARLGFKSVFVLGHANYYPRFGFMPASFWGIRPPYPVPNASFTAIELVERGLEGVSGLLVYPKEFEE